MGRRVDLDDLLDSAEVANVLELSDRGAVSVYRGRYDDFPQPAVEKGRCQLWLRADIEAWDRARRGTPAGHEPTETDAK